MIAAHRGTAGGNIPCNTLTAYEIALRDGADIIELDVAKSLDGKLFCFHPGMEHVMYADSTPIAQMTGHGILQTRILEWVAFPFSRGSSCSRNQTQVS